MQDGTVKVCQAMGGTVIHTKGVTMRHHRFLLFWIVMAASSSAYAADTLEEFAKQCDEAIGVTVPDFSCDKGTEVPDTHPTSTPAKYGPGVEKCDRPNHLNKECDPGSRFQVLSSDANSYVVAHCRKQGHAPLDGKYSDIAVIQHNVNNGATCFYQALQEDAPGGLDGKNVKAPSKGGAAWPWKTPAKSAGIGCGACHDNGPIVRSPYLSQVKGADGKLLLPGAKEPFTFNNSGEPYYFVGSDFASWKAFKVEVKNNECTNCHRMGVNNVPIHGSLGANGTSKDFGLRATAKDQGLTDKNSLSADSPMWMVPDDPDGSGLDKFSQAHADSAKAIKDCADKFKAGSPLPNTDACRITQFAGRWKLSAVRWQGAAAYFFKGDRYSVFDAKADNTKTGDPKSITTDWSGLWEGGLDAAILWGNGKAYVFKGDQYVRLDAKTRKIDTGYPAPIARSWPGVWVDGVDAAVPWNNGKVYFFKGDQYIQYDVKADKSDTGYPKPIKDGWPGVWQDGIDAAIQWNDEIAYFFRGDQYIKYNVKANKIEPGYPIPVKGHWPGAKW
jgi:hypothetical protein